MSENDMRMEEEFEELDTQKDKYMTFRLCDDVYGINIRYVNEIVGLSKITEIPDTDDYIKGLLNLRGKIVPIIDVRMRFQKEPIPYNDRTCAIIAVVENTVVGLIVDEIAEVVSIPAEEIVCPPKVGSGGGKHFIYGIGKVGDEVKLLIDPEKLLFDEQSETDSEPVQQESEGGKQ